jgi:predicted enzyme related to lactoylglutathione lyase
MSQRSIVHIEIPSADPTAAAEFYSKLFGWEYNSVPEFDYATFATENTGGGFPRVSDMYRQGDVVVYIESDDLEADLERIEAHGGKAVGEPMEVPGFGWFAFFTDPTGNRLALWKDTSGQ